MTAPRQVLPGTSYLITRRCARRELLLRPSPVTSAIFLYVLAVAAERFGILVHAFCVMSNHFHLVVTDPYARLPAFEQYLDSLVARAVNASLGRWEAFWAPSSYSAVVLSDAEDIVAKAAYTLANPVAAGLVRTGSEWPGLRSTPEDVGGAAIRAARPSVFFRQNGRMPASATITLSAPPGFGSAEEFGAKLAEAVEALEARARRDADDAGRRFLGARKVLAQRTTSRPSIAEPRRGLNPRVAARDKWKRIEVLGRLAEFVVAYREALAAFRAGARDVIFPPGTYQLRLVHGVRCAPG